MSENREDKNPNINITQSKKAECQNILRINHDAIRDYLNGRNFDSVESVIFIINFACKGVKPIGSKDIFYKITCGSRKKAQDLLSGIDKEAAEKLRTLEGVAVIVIEPDVIEVLRFPNAP